MKWALVAGASAHGILRGIAPWEGLLPIAAANLRRWGEASRRAVHARRQNVSPW